MDHRNATFELGLHLGIAGGGETQLPKLLVLLSERTVAQCCGDAGDNYQTLRPHADLRERVRSSRSPTDWIKHRLPVMRANSYAGCRNQDLEIPLAAFRILHLSCLFVERYT